MTTLLLIALILVVAAQAAVIVVLLSRRLVGVVVEVWGVTADELGIFLVSRNGSEKPDAWRTDRLRIGNQPHTAVTELLRQHGELEACVFRHSTSWRPDWKALARGDGLVIVLTYVAVLGMFSEDENGELVGDAGGMLANPPRRPYRFAYEVWPWLAPLHARLVNLDTSHRFHGPNERPKPAYMDVLLHAVRHLLFLLWTDTEAQAQLDRHWQRWLGDRMAPALAGMYVRGSNLFPSEPQ
jgi:hypothetical protein